MEKITNEMLDKRVKLIEDYLRDLGLLEGEEVEEYKGAMRSPHLVLQKGSRTYGLGWRLHLSGGSKYGSAWYEFPFLSWSYLGSTRAEAWQTLDGIRAGLAIALREKEKARAGA